LEQVQGLKLPAGLSLSALVIDDGSDQPLPAKGFTKGSLSGLSVLKLARNLGHQGALAVGLSHLVQAGGKMDAVVILDGDGEDAPSDILRLIEAWDGAGRRQAVFARRDKRSESLAFQFFYRCYQAAYRLLTGHGIAMGNFSLLPKALLPQLTLYPELWRHYPATVKKARLDALMLSTSRAPRLQGRSQMNFHRLVLHGLGAIAVHSDIVGVRSLVAVMSILGACSVGGLLLVLALILHWVVPGWAYLLLMTLSLAGLQFLGSALLFSFLTLAGNSPLALHPQRDYKGFIQGLHKIY
jgi:glycosyltransferase involved in cell wall biosynthesis